MGFLDSIKKGFAMEDEDRPIPNTLDELVRTSGSSEAGRGRVIVVEPMRMEECNALVECIRHGLVVSSTPRSWRRNSPAASWTSSPVRLVPLTVVL